MKTKVSLVSIAGAESLSMERRMCLSSPCRHSPTSLCGGYTLLLYRAAVSYLQARCHRRSLVRFSRICAVPCSCDIQLDLMATSPVFHCPVAHFSRLRTSVLTCCEFPCVLLSTLVSYISACLRRVHNLFGFGVCFGNAKCVAGQMFTICELSPSLRKSNPLKIAIFCCNYYFQKIRGECYACDRKFE